MRFSAQEETCTLQLLSVFVQWVWTYLTGQRGSRLIVNHYGLESIRTPDATELAQMRKYLRCVRATLR
jgi:hypothetical protein